MPLMLPKQRGLRREASTTGRLTTTYGTLLTASATIHTLGTKAVLFASTSFDTHWVDIYVHGSWANATNTNQLMNIYVGGAGVEQVLIPNMQTGWARALAGANLPFARTYSFPLRIPAGSRITADLQAVIASDTVRVWMVLFGGDSIPHWTGTRVETIGADTTLSRGKLVVPGTTSEGTLTRLDPVTLGAPEATLAHDWGFVFPSDAGSSDATTASAIDHLDLGTSAAVIPGLEDWRSQWPGTSEDTFTFDNGRFCFVPEGTVLHARVQSSSAANSRTIIAHGVY